MLNNNDYAVEAYGLTRIYQAKTGILRRKIKEVVALHDVNFCIEKGEMFGLLGPNGAGKTTTVKILATLLNPTAGQAFVLGQDVVQQTNRVRPHIGFVFGGERGLYWRLSGYDNLTYFANLYHLPAETQKQRIPALLEMVGLGGRGDEKVEGYSRGMKQRLHIARALLHDPQILFLDEPTLGLDPVGARELREAIRGMRGEKTILLTTHYMFEADALCKRVAIIDKGKIIALDTPTGLKQHAADLSVVEIEAFYLPQEAIERVRSLAGVGLVSVENREQQQVLRVHTVNGSALIAPLVNILKELGLQVGKVTIHEPTLEDAYIQLVEAKT